LSAQRTFFSLFTPDYACHAMSLIFEAERRFRHSTWPRHATRSDTRARHERPMSHSFFFSASRLAFRQYMLPAAPTSPDAGRLCCLPAADAAPR
jgi:hypothetical protein